MISEFIEILEMKIFSETVDITDASEKFAKCINILANLLCQYELKISNLTDQQVLEITSVICNFLDKEYAPTNNLNRLVDVLENLEQ